MLRLVTDSHVPPRIAIAARKLAPLEITAYRQNDVGGIARGLVKLWRTKKNLDWTNLIVFLD